MLKLLYLVGRRKYLSFPVYSIGTIVFIYLSYITGKQFHSSPRVYVYDCAVAQPIDYRKHRLFFAPPFMPMLVSRGNAGHRGLIPINQIRMGCLELGMSI